MFVLFSITRWVPKQLTPEHKSKSMESALTLLRRYHDDGEKFLDRSSQVMKRGLHTLPPINQAAVNALASQWISLFDEIQADFVGAESDVHGVLGQKDFVVSKNANVSEEKALFPEHNCGNPIFLPHLIPL